MASTTAGHPPPSAAPAPARPAARPPARPARPPAPVHFDSARAPHTKRTQQSRNLQVILTTNDRFVMNAVPIDYWTVLDRRGNTVHVFNKSNSGDKFESFKFTGLSNFDFFATDYVTTAEHDPT